MARRRRLTRIRPGTPPEFALLVLKLESLVDGLRMSTEEARQIIKLYRKLPERDQRRARAKIMGIEGGAKLPSVSIETRKGLALAPEPINFQGGIPGLGQR
jgi:hypothetical protein